MPTREDIKKLVAEIKSGTPRASAVVAGTVVEDVLKQLLLSRMVQMPVEDRNQLFGSYGPLNTFGAKIALGYAFGVYGPNTRGDLLTLKAVRNAFAHASIVINLDTVEVAALCSGFNCLRGLKDKQ